jgi:outer membrane protein assembly factor BamB
MQFRPLVRTFLILISVSIGVSGQPRSLTADDWNGWMGNDRDGVYRETGIVSEIPDDGLPVKWRTPVAGGYAGPAVADGRVYVFDFVKSTGDVMNHPTTRVNMTGSERLQALDAATGKPIWEHRYDCIYNISYPAGPRCTPTIDGDRVYILGSEGDLRCLNVEDGQLVWKKNLPADFGSEVPLWGYSSHPLINGDLLYTMAGGTGQAVVALDKMTGEVQWKAIDDTAGYCPPAMVEFGGKSQLMVFHPTGLTSLNPADGEQYWTLPIKPDYEMSINRPMIDGDRMYTSGIHQSALMIKLNSVSPNTDSPNSDSPNTNSPSTNSPSVTELWRGEKDKAIYCANSTPLFVDGVVYGCDCNLGALVAIDANDGSRLWTTFDATRPGVTRFVKHGTGFLTRIGDSDQYLVFNETGDLQINKMTRQGFESMGSFHVLEPTGNAFNRDVVWSHPAYADRTAYVRNDVEIVAVDLASQ